MIDIRPNEQLKHSINTVGPQSPERSREKNERKERKVLFRNIIFSEGWGRMCGWDNEIVKAMELMYSILMQKKTQQYLCLSFCVRMGDRGE